MQGGFNKSSDRTGAVIVMSCRRRGHLDNRVTMVACVCETRDIVRERA